MAYSKTLFGTMPDGRPVYAYTLVNSRGTECTLLDLGAIWNRMAVRDRYGNKRDVILGYDQPESYLTDAAFFGAVVGRNANRIAGGHFTLEGKEYQLAVNNGPNNLHSGPDVYRNRIWEASAGADEAGSYAQFSLWSEDGDQGFPGKARIEVRYTLDEDDGVTISYAMVATKTTVANFTNHVYFNLAGQETGKIMDQKVRILADAFTPTDAVSIPTGEIRPVAGTPMDFREWKEIGREIGADYEQLTQAAGYDHNYVIQDWDGTVRLAAEAVCEESGIGVEVYTDRPGVQFYTGNYIDGEKPGKGGAAYDKRAGYCFETQAYPDTLNHPNFPTTVLPEGKEFRSVTTYRFVCR